MRSDSTIERISPLSGVLFAGFLILLFVLTGSSPDANDKTVDVVRYWNNHDSKEIVASLAGGVAVAFFIWFAGTLRSMFRRVEGGAGTLSAISYGGALLFAFGGAIGSGLEFAAADTAGEVPAGVTQTLSVLNADLFIPFLASILVFQAANACLILAHGGLPRWLGYFSIVIAVISVTPIGFIGFPLMIIWVLIASILMFRQVPEAPEALGASAPAQ